MKRSRYPASGLIACVAVALLVASPATASERVITFGADGKDGFRKAVVVPGGYVLGGWKDRVGTYDVGHGWVVAVDEDGARLWDTQFRGDGASQVSALAALSNGGVLVALEEFPNAEAPGQTWLIELAASGDIERRVLLGGSGKDVVDTIRPAPGGGFWLAGETSSGQAAQLDGWLLRLDEDYRELANLHFGGPGDDRFNDLYVGDDGDVTAVGRIATADQRDLGWVVRVSAQNEPVWQRRIDAAHRSSIRAIAPTDNGFAVAGFVRNQPDGEFALWFAGLDQLGSPTWLRQLGRLGPGFAFSLVTDGAGGFLAAGALADAARQPFDAVAVRLDAAGSLQSIHRHGGPGSEQARVALPRNEGYVLFGYASVAERQEDGWLLFVD